MPSTLEAWNDLLEDRPIPISAIEVPWVPLPHARLLVDLWVFAPRSG